MKLFLTFLSGKLKFRIRSIQDQLFLLKTFLFLEIFKFCLCYKCVTNFVNFCNTFSFLFKIPGSAWERDLVKNVRFISSVGGRDRVGIVTQNFFGSRPKPGSRPEIFSGRDPDLGRDPAGRNPIGSRPEMATGSTR